jgi:hypothetical protein
MINIKYISLIAVVLILYLSGCAPTQQITVDEPLILPDADKDLAMHAAQDVLSEMLFFIEKFDPQAGVIRTKPLTAAQFFEFWRQDNVGTQTAAQANLHSMQRIVLINVSERDNNICVECQVQVRRLSIPEKEFASISQAANMFTTGSTSLQKLEINDDQQEKMAWVDLGPDHALEHKILTLIQKRISKQQGRT